jgi:hypothetical protein
MTGMREFWDERAREDAFYFADGEMAIEQYVGGGTQFMLVRLRRM